jgi:hypothetical protein
VTRRARRARKRQILASTTYAEHLLDMYCVQIPGATTAAARRKLKREKVRA